MTDKSETKHALFKKQLVVTDWNDIVMGIAFTLVAIGLSLLIYYFISKFGIDTISDWIITFTILFFSGISIIMSIICFTDGLDFKSSLDNYRHGGM